MGALRPDNPPVFIPIGDINTRRRVPFVNYLLLAINVWIGLNTLLFMSPARYEWVILRYGFIPAEGFDATVLLSQFLHGGLAHLLGNMLFLWIVGDNVEDKMGHLGYLAFYLSSGVAAAAAHWWMNPLSEIPVIGASGAISGVMAAYAILFSRSRIKILYFIPIFVFIEWGVLTVRALWAIGFWFVEQLLLTYLSAGLGERAGVAYGAHVGGFVFGGAAVLALVGSGALRRNRGP